MHRTSPGEDGWYRSNIFRGWWGLAIWGHFFMSIWLWGPPCPSRRHMLSLCFFPQGQVVGSNSIAAKFHSSVLTYLPLSQGPFPTDQIALPFWGKKKYFVFKSIF